MAGSVLVAERDPEVREELREALCHDGYHVEVAYDLATSLVHAPHVDVIVADLSLGIADALRARNPLAEIVVVAWPSRIDDALAAVRRGAFDFVLRPFFVDDISISVACACARAQRVGFDNVLAHVPKNCELLR